MTPPRPSRWRRAMPGASRIAARLFAFNLLLLFLPIAAILYLDVYETRLLESQERGMVQEGRILAAGLADAPSFDATTVARGLAQLGERGEARFRVYDAGPALIADTNRITFEREQTAVRPYSVPPPEDVRGRALYRLGAWIVRARGRAIDWARRILVPRHDTTRSAEASGIPYEVRTALRGRYGAATRQTPGQRSLTLSAAVPIRRGSDVIGAVLVSQTTFRVLQALYEVRLRIFEVVIGSILAAALLTTLAAATVVRPIRRLRDEAAALADRRHRLPGQFPDADRRDELGDLARALQELTRRLDEHIRQAERFASDVSHEFKNPLASIRAAAETALQSEDSSERARFLGMLTRDVDRLEGLVSGVRELTRIDAQLEQEPMQRVNVEVLLSEVIDGLRLAHGDSPMPEALRRRTLSSTFSWSPTTGAAESMYPIGGRESRLLISIGCSTVSSRIGPTTCRTGATTQALDCRSRGRLFRDTGERSPREIVSAAEPCSRYPCRWLGRVRDLPIDSLLIPDLL